MPGTPVEVKKLGEYKQNIVEYDGLKWVIGTGGDDQLVLAHESDPPGYSIHDFICKQFAPGVVFLDIGAHAGHYTVRAARAGCVVYAVEANPESAARLRMNLHINRLQATVWSFAAWNRQQLLHYYQGEDAPGYMRNGSASLEPSPRNKASMRMTVAGFPLDLALTGLAKLDVVKMDVEGSDIHVLDGMIDSLARFKPLLIFEDHQFYGTYDRADMIQRERELTVRAGYAWFDGGEKGVRSAERFRIGTPPGRRH